MTFPLPEDDSQVVILGIMASLELEAAREFAEFLDHRFKAAGNPEWFEDISDFRRQAGAQFAYLAPDDLRFILLEAIQPDSQIWHHIPNMSQMWVSSAKTLRSKLNLLHHQQLRPDLNNLLVLADLFVQVTGAPGLEVAAWARAIKSRVKTILDGTYKSVTAKPEELPAVTTESASDLTQSYIKVLKEREVRPPIGEPWASDLPSRKLTVSRHTREIYDSNGSAVGHELGPLRTEVVDSWLRYFPLGGEVWVAEDGATMGYVRGVAKMIGWFGPAPDQDSDVVRGFALENEYEFTGADVMDLQSGKALSESAPEGVEKLLDTLSKAVPPQTILKVTDYGDVFASIPDEVPKRIVRTHKGNWFPGQLPE